MTNVDRAAGHAERGLVLARKGKLKEAISELRRALRLAPDHTTARYNLALALHKQGKYGEAVAQCQKLVSIAPEADTFVTLGNAYLALGRRQDAVTAYRDALFLRHSHFLAYYNLGAALAECGQHEEAVAAYRSAAILNPEDTELISRMNTSLDLMDR